MFGSKQTIHHSPLQMIQDPTVIVVSGWGGSGKTQTIARALMGLSDNINKVGVIINERSQGSVDVDLARLPKGFEKLGLHGCACCSQLSDVLDGVGSFKSQGRSLTFIEQSPLSVTGDLRTGLRQRGHSAVVVFLFNPAQFNDAPGLHVQGIRDADVVVVTHQSGRSALADRASRIVETARGDLAKIPVLLDGDPQAPFSQGLWRAVHDVRTGRPSGVLQGIVGLFRAAPRPASDFHAERDALVRNYSEVSVKPYHNTPEEVLSAVKTLRSKGIEISRVKGTLLNGVSVDVVKEGDAYSLKASGLVEGVGYLSLRSFATELRRHVGALAAHLGTPECGPAFVKQVLSGYPGRDALERSIQNGNVPMGFEADRLLVDLREVLPHMKYISDDGRIEELGEALVATMRASIQTRLSVIHALSSGGPDRTQNSLGLMNALYHLLDMVTDTGLGMLYEHPDLASLRTEVQSVPFNEVFPSVVSSLPRLRFEGRKDLSRGDLRRFGSICREAAAQGVLKVDAVERMFAAIEGSSDMDTQAYGAVLREGV